MDISNQYNPLLSNIPYSTSGISRFSRLLLFLMPFSEDNGNQVERYRTDVAFKSTLLAEKEREIDSLREKIADYESLNATDTLIGQQLAQEALSSLDKLYNETDKPSDRAIRYQRETVKINDSADAFIREAMQAE